MKYIITFFSGNLLYVGALCFLNSIMMLNDKNIKVILGTTSDAKEIVKRYNFIEVIQLNNLIPPPPYSYYIYKIFYINRLIQNYKFEKDSPIFICDYSDVIFQRNIFNNFFKDGCHLFSQCNTRQADCIQYEASHEKFTKYFCTDLQLINGGLLYFTNYEYFRDFYKIIMDCYYCGYFDKQNGDYHDQFLYNYAYYSGKFKIYNYVNLYIHYQFEDNILYAAVISDNPAREICFNKTLIINNEIVLQKKTFNERIHKIDNNIDNKTKIFSYDVYHSKFKKNDINLFVLNKYGTY